MRILIALAVVVVFGAAMLFDTAALVQLLLIAVTGDFARIRCGCWWRAESSRRLSCWR